MAKKSKDKSLKFGVGEYEAISEDRERISIQEMRRLFLSQASNLIPQVAQHLENELLGLYQQIPLFCYEAYKKQIKEEPSRMIWHNSRRPTWTRIEEVWNNRLPDVPINEDSNVEVFIEKMFDWSIHYNLDAMWCRDHAYETLDLWCQSSEYCKARIWTYKEYDPRVGRPFLLGFHDAPEFKFKYTTFYPSHQFRQDVKQIIMKEFQEELEAFLDKCEHDAKKKGMVAVPQKHALHHFEWLADYQVNKLSKSRLAKKHRVDRKTIIDGINSAAALIKLALRK